MRRNVTTKEWFTLIIANVIMAEIVFFAFIILGIGEWSYGIGSPPVHDYSFPVLYTALCIGMIITGETVRSYYDIIN